MAKGQKRSAREPRKPKQAKAKPAAASSPFLSNLPGARAPAGKASPRK